MKVLLVSSKYQPEYSGSGFRAHNLYKRLSKKFIIDYDVVCNSLMLRKNEIYKFDGVEVCKIAYPYNYEKLNGLKRKFHILLSMFYEFYYSYKFIKKKNIKNYDLIHTFGNSWSIAFLTYYFYLKKKPIIRELVNNMNTPYYPIQFEKFFRKVFQKNNTMMVAISKKLENLCKKYGVKKIWMRPNPIEEKFFLVDKKEKLRLRAKLTDFSNEDIILMHIASYMRQKNHIFILDILTKLPKKYKLFLGGPVESSEHEENYNLVQNKIKELNLNDRVLLTKGFITNIDEYIKLCDIFLFPTWNEALGTPILEAQACGVPVVANLMPGSTDSLIKEGVGGYLVEKFDVKIWAEKTELALNINDETLRENSSNILKIASTKNIDEEYFKKINSII